MEIPGFVRYVSTVSAAALLLAVCNGSQPPIDAPGAMTRSWSMEQGK